MKIWLSRPGERTGKRQIVLDLTHREEHEIRDVLMSTVIGWRGRAPKRVVRRDGTVRYRFSREHMDRLLATFPFADLSPGLERRQRRAAQHLLDEEVPELDLPDFHGDLYDFQKIGVAHAIEGLKADGTFMLNDEMGLGKTVQALAVAVKMMPLPILVVCPNSAKFVWEAMIARFTDFESVVLDANVQDKEARTALINAGADVTIVNVEALRNHPELAAHRYGLVISDEVHRFKNPKAAQTKGWMKLRMEYHLMMTGTPILNRVEEIWSALHRAYPERYPDYQFFCGWLCLKSKAMEIPERDEEGNPVRDEHGRMVFRKIPGRVVGYKPKAYAQLKKHLADPLVSLRRRKDQVLDDLPEVIVNTVLTELTPEQRRLYRKIVADYKLELANGQISSIRGALPVITRCKQAAFSPELYGGSRTSQKISELKTLVRELVDDGRKALIGSQWSKAARIIERELAEYNPAYVDGKVRGRARMAEIERFNEDEDTWLYIGTIQANQEAITLGAADTVVFTDKLWSPLANMQFIGRSAAGGLRGVDSDQEVVNIVELLAHNTIEERIEKVLAEKFNIFNSFVELDGGAIRKQITLTELSELF